MLTDQRRWGAPSFRDAGGGQALSNAEREVPMHAVVVHVKTHRFVDSEGRTVDGIEVRF